MLKITLCEGAHDEHSLLGYEKHDKGDQTGDEVRYHDYYSCVGYDKAKPWTYVFRPVDKNCANAISIRMKQCADNPYVGYGQVARTDILYALLRDPDPSHIKYPIDCDCSSLVNSVVLVTYKAIGITLPMNGCETTAMMPAKYTGMKEHFKNVTKSVNISTGEGLMVGDILVRPMSHTAVVVGVEEPSIVRPTTLLNIREFAGTYRTVNNKTVSNKIVYVARTGEELIPTGNSTKVGNVTWIRVKCKNGVIGWCSSRYVK